MPPAPPLGIGDGEVESRRFQVEDGSLFVLYTDGLVENKGQDIDDGLARLRGIFGPGSPTRPLEDLCKAALDGVYSDHQRDDIAMLIARLRRLPEDSYASWTLAPKLTSVRRGAFGAGRADEAVGAGGPDPHHRAARLRAGDQRGPVLARRGHAPAGPRAGPGLRGARLLRRAAEAAPRRTETTRTAAACRSSASSPSAGAPAGRRPARSSGASSRCRAALAMEEPQPFH